MQIPYNILTTRTESWGLIKSSVLYLLVHMELSLHPSIYLKRSLRGGGGHGGHHHKIPS
jgi:hypothetical protein